MPVKPFRFVHASGDTFMSFAKTKADAQHVLGLNPEPLWVTITEAGEAARLADIRPVVQRHGYHLLNPDRGDIAFMVHPSLVIHGMGGLLSIPAVHKPARDGGHGPRFNSWFHAAWEGEDLYVNGCHLVTLHTQHGPGAGGHARPGEQDMQLRSLGARMRQQARGHGLSIGSGDLNGNALSRADYAHIFTEYGMTTTAEETHNHQPTHLGGARLDWAWTMDRDKRLSVKRMHVVRHDVKSDHFVLVNDCEIA